MPPPSAEEIRRGADEILSRPEFQEAPRSLYQRVLDWIGDRIADVIDALVTGGTGAVVAWVLLLALIGVVGYLVVRAVQGGRRRRPDTEGGVGTDVVVDDRRPAAAWAAEAARLEGEGRWRDALRCRYRALVAGLAGAGVVEEIPGRTAGEYRLLVRQSRPAVDEPFGGATDLFEQAWYGEADTGPEDTAAFRALADRVTAGTAP